MEGQEKPNTDKCKEIAARMFGNRTSALALFTSLPDSNLEDFRSLVLVHRVYQNELHGTKSTFYNQAIVKLLRMFFHICGSKVSSPCSQQQRELILRCINFVHFLKACSFKIILILFTFKQNFAYNRRWIIAFISSLTMMLRYRYLK